MNPVEKNTKIIFPENWKAEAVELRPDSPESLVAEVVQFLEHMQGQMGVFEHLGKYFTQPGDATKRIRESLAWTENGTRHVTLFKFVYGDEKNKGDIFAITLMSGREDKKMVEVAIYLEPDFQAKGVAQKIIAPEILKAFKENFKNKNSSYKLVVSSTTPEAKKMLEKIGVSLVPVENEPEYFEIKF